MTPARFSIVVAASASSYGIGRLGDLPWKIPADMKYFKTLTTEAAEGKQNIVIMGRKTWESIPSQHRPLPGRRNIVLSQNPSAKDVLNLPSDVLLAPSLVEALSLYNAKEHDKVFVIGGGSVYKEALQSSSCEKIYLTEVSSDKLPVMDTFFPIIPADKFQLVKRSLSSTYKDYSYRFLEFQMIDDNAFQISQNPEEQQYLDLVKDILQNGVIRGDRTGTGTISKFGVQMRFSLRNKAFPLLTTKKVFWRGVAEELLWFVKGSTDAIELSDKGIHIWDGNGSREFLDSRGLHERAVGDLGPVYGFQWRHFGAEYKDMHSDYTNCGIDQLKECVDKIKTNPEDRRIIMTAWNPADLGKMALPPCHMFCQFYVANGELSCQMYQRSADMGLGVPFNIASYSLLTVMVAKVCGLEAGDFVHTIGDAHVYLNHVDGLKEQILRKPRPFPKLLVNPGVKDIDGFDYEDFTIEGYSPEGAIKMKMAI